MNKRTPAQRPKSQNFRFGGSSVRSGFRAQMRRKASVRPSRESPTSSVSCGGRVIATGLGILDRDEAGLYAVHTGEAFRQKGIASSVIRTILAEASRRGAKGAYLQVVSGNAPARRLYSREGFTDAYTCWYRVKSFE